MIVIPQINKYDKWGSLMENKQGKQTSLHRVKFTLIPILPLTYFNLTLISPSSLFHPSFTPVSPHSTPVLPHFTPVLPHFTPVLPHFTRVQPNFTFNLISPLFHPCFTPFHPSFTPFHSCFTPCHPSFTPFHLQFYHISPTFQFYPQPNFTLSLIHLSQKK